MASLGRHRIHPLRRHFLVGGVVAAAALSVTVAVTSPTLASAAEVYPLPPTGTVTVRGHGFGHGHGMSQYGAQGAARAGLTATQIVAFYYPGTVLSSEPAGTTIRVLIGGAGGATCVRADAGMTATGVSGTLPTSGTQRFRLVPSGTGLALQRNSGATCANTGWTTLKTGLPTRVDFAAAQGFVRLYRSDGTSTDYRGSVGAVRQGSGEITVNRLGLDAYTIGVVPREMPASWEAEAVRAQAIAARTYGDSERVAHAADAYDICDSDQCQVYGGMTHYDASGSALWHDDPAAVTGNSMRVLRYNGSVAFAQFSASDGGWTADGGEPYLVAKADPYEAKSDDPYLNWTRTPSVASIAAYYGLARVTAIGITQRDGHGDMGGRVLAGYVDGVTPGGQGTRLSVSGFSLQAAMGLPHHWFALQITVPGPPQSVAGAAADAGGTVSWQPPASSGGVPITGYSLTFGPYRLQVPAGARSAYVGPLVNLASTVVQVRAINAVGSGSATSVTLKPTPQPDPLVPVNPTRMFDTRPSGTLVTPTSPLVFGVPGHAGVPSGARSVQFALTIVNPSASGTLSVYTSGVFPGRVSAISYRAGRTQTVTVSVPLRPSPMLRFLPSAGSMGLVADLLGYQLPTTGQRITLARPVTVTDIAHVPTAGATIPLAGVSDVTATTTAVVLSVQGRTSGGTGWLRLWPSGSTEGATSPVTVGTGGSDSGLVIVPIGPARSVNIRSSSNALGARVTLVGVVGSTGGLLESVPMTPLADPAGGSAAVAIGATPTSVTVLGTPQVPTTGVTGVLLHVTATSTTAGTLTLTGAGSSADTAPTIGFPAGAPATGTLLVPVGTGGAIDISSSGAAASVAIDTIGYVTAG